MQQNIKQHFEKYLKDPMIDHDAIIPALVKQILELSEQVERLEVVGDD